MHKSDIQRIYKIRINGFNVQELVNYIIKLRHKVDNIKLCENKAQKCTQLKKTRSSAPKH